MRLFSRLIWLLVFSVALFVAVWTSVQAWRVYNAKYWPTTDGVVSGFYGTPDYRYSVAGRNYTGSTVAISVFSNWGLFVANSSKYAVRYPINAKVKVHYCPTDPSLAVLETPFDLSIIGFIAVLVSMTALCFAGFVFGWPLRVRARFSLGS